MAVLRDVPFSQYGTANNVSQAAGTTPSGASHVVAGINCPTLLVGFEISHGSRSVSLPTWQEMYCWKPHDTCDDPFPSYFP